MNPISSPCIHAELVESYAQRQLRFPDVMRFETHLFACRHCLDALEFELLVKRAVADFARSPLISRSWH